MSGLLYFCDWTHDMTCDVLHQGCREDNNIPQLKNIVYRIRLIMDIDI